MKLQISKLLCLLFVVVSWLSMTTKAVAQDCPTPDILPLELSPTQDTLYVAWTTTSSNATYYEVTISINGIVFSTTTSNSYYNYPLPSNFLSYDEADVVAVTVTSICVAGENVVEISSSEYSSIEGIKAPHIVATVQPVERNNRTAVSCTCNNETAGIVKVIDYKRNETVITYYSRLAFCSQTNPVPAPLPDNFILLSPCSISAKYGAEQEVEENFSAVLIGENLSLSYTLYQDNWAMIRLYDITGQAVGDVLAPAYQKAGKYTTNLDMQYLPKGLYFCVLNDGIEQTTQKILKSY